MAYQFKQNKYTKHYMLLIEKAKKTIRHRSDAESYENHHIIPKSLGGTNSQLNLVYLTLKEHFIAHLLLIKMVNHTDVYKMINAIRRFKSRKHIKTATEYALTRRLISNNSKGNFNPSFGKIWIHNSLTKEIFYIKKEDFEQYDTNIFIKGLPYQRGGNHNTIRINNGIRESFCQKELLETFLSTGWTKGRLNPPPLDHMKLMSKKRHTPEKNIAHSKKLSGRIAVKHNTTGEIKRILASDALKYEQMGYLKPKFITNASSKRCMIDNVKYDSIAEAANLLNLSTTTINYRLSSTLEKWKNWIKIDNLSI